jgi:ankyrin repeat protein
MALIDAIKQQDLEKVIKISLQINEKRTNRILGLAAKFGALNIVKYFSKGKPKDCEACNIDIIEIDEDQIRAKNHICCEIPLIFAAANGHYEVVKYLKEKGADIRSNDDLAFRCAAKGGYLEVVEYLVELGADIHAGDNSCALKKAAEYGHYEVVKYLYETAGFYVGEGFGRCKSDALNLACINGDIQTVHYLRFEAEASLQFETVLNAAKNGHLQLVKEFIDDGANVRKFDDYALHWACGNGHFEMVKYLIEEVGANIESNRHFTVEQAAQYGHLEILKYLCEKKNANFKCNNNYPLRVAAWNGHLEVVKYLHEKGADIRSRNNYALRYSIENGHLPVVKYLIQAGVEINDDCYRWATWNNHLHIVKYLYEVVSQPHMAKVINDLMMSACNRGYFKLIKYFMEQGADTSEIDSPYFLFYMKMQKKIRERAQKSIYFWWIPICYDLNRECGKRMMIKNLEKARELGMEFN